MSFMSSLPALQWALLALACFGLPGPAAMAAPPQLSGAEEIAALGSGHWLVQEKRQLRLLATDGRELARLPMRGGSMDLRPRADGDGARVAVYDSAAQQARLFDVRLSPASIEAAAALPTAEFAVESLCLYRDAGKLDHLYLIGKDGRAEQWLLDGIAPRLLRRLALPPGVVQCRVDDTRHRLYVAEEGFGVWAYAADGEGVPTRTPVAAVKPWGNLDRAPAALAVTTDGLAVLESEHGRLHRLAPHQGRWREASGSRTLHGDQLALVKGSLWLRRGNRWQALPSASARSSAGIAPPPTLRARVQTIPVERLGDAADDPAIWLHPSERNQSLVLATNKKQGLLVYDLQGQQRQLIEAGRLNNVDVRQGVIFGAQRRDLAVATQRDERALALFEINRDGQVRDAGRIVTELDDIYGACLYQPPAGGLEAFVNDKDGRFLHYRIEAHDGRYAGVLLRRFALASQPEGCVADDAQGRLFMGEEKRGIWVVTAPHRQNAGGDTAPRLIMPVGGALVADVEGLALYHGRHASYLIASSQGNSSYVVLDATPPFAYRGSFRIGIDAGLGIDGVSDTDGLEASAENFGGEFVDGMLVVQDGYKRLPDGAQNFKYVAWRDIAAALGL